MRTLLFTVLALFLCLNASAQCNPYYDIKKGMEWEMTSYNAKDKLEGRNVTTVKKFETTSNGWDAIMSIKAYDKKDELVLEQDDVEMTCADGVIDLNMERFIPKESLEAFKDMNMQMEVDNAEIPENLEVGMELDDGSVTITGNIPMTMKTTITDRKVVAREEIETPAGKFDCFKITYNIEMKMGMKRTMKGVEWIAKNVGVVRSESYNGRDKLMGYSLLTKVK